MRSLVNLERSKLGSLKLLMLNYSVLEVVDGEDGVDGVGLQQQVRGVEEGFTCNFTFPKL